MVNTIGSSKSLYDDKDCRSIGSSDFNKNEAKNNICDTIISEINNAQNNKDLNNNSESGSNVTSSTEKASQMLMEIRDRNEMPFVRNGKMMSDVTDNNKDNVIKNNKDEMSIKIPLNNVDHNKTDGVDVIESNKDNKSLLIHPNNVDLNKTYGVDTSCESNHKIDNNKMSSVTIDDNVEMNKSDSMVHEKSLEVMNDLNRSDTNNTVPKVDLVAPVLEPTVIKEKRIISVIQMKYMKIIFNDQNTSFLIELILNYVGWLKYDSVPWIKYEKSRYLSDEWYQQIKHPKCTDNYQQSIYYPYHPSSYLNNRKRWCIHSYYCSDLVSSNVVNRKQYTGIILEGNDKPSATYTQKIKDVQMWKYFCYVAVVVSESYREKVELYSKLKFRSIYDKLFACGMGDPRIQLRNVGWNDCRSRNGVIFDNYVPKCIKVGEHYELNGIPCYKLKVHTLRKNANLNGLGGLTIRDYHSKIKKLIIFFGYCMLILGIKSTNTKLNYLIIK